MTAYLERKVKPGGAVHEYETELLRRTAGAVVARFMMTRGGGPPRFPVEVPAGSVSYGFFWAKRPYSLYRWVDAGGRVIAHRFDAVTAVEISDAGVTYRDLALDWWALPDGRLIEDDRDELEALVAEGTMTAREAALAEEAARAVYRGYRRAIDEVEAVLRGLEALHGRGGREYSADV